jgi:hypothetical protein
LQRHPPVPDKLDKTLKALALAILTTNELKKLDSNNSDLLFAPSFTLMSRTAAP